MATFSGTSGADTLKGTDLADVMKGLGGKDTLTGLNGDDTLNGGAGADTMTGGLGNDLYIVDDSNDRTIEASGGGFDRVKASINWTLADNVEVLFLTGTGTISGTGNAMDNRLVGNAAANKLIGLDGNDTLDGQGGGDRLIGGMGNDTYIVDNPNDVCTEQFGQGTDTVKSGISRALETNIEKLLLTGTAATNGTGNTANNTLTGNDAANALSGLAGNDTIIGGGGNDTLTGGVGVDKMTGGLGNDTFAFATLSDTGRDPTTADEIVDFTAGDKVDLHLIDAVVQASGYGEFGDQPFVFIGANRFHNHTGGELRYEISGGNTYIYGEVNGDTTGDFCIKLDGVHTLTSSDFVL